MSAIKLDLRTPGHEVATVLTAGKRIVTGSAIHIEQGDPPRSPKEVLPTMYDLPSEDPEQTHALCRSFAAGENVFEPDLPDEFHDLQSQLLSRTLSLTGYSRDNYFTASDLNICYHVRQRMWHKRPDWFLVLDVPRLYEQRDLRRSYVFWQEGELLDVVVEVLSPGTEAEDLGRFYNESATVVGADAIVSYQIKKCLRQIGHLE